MNWINFIKDNKQAITNRNNILKGKKAQQDISFRAVIGELE
jgi:hypothetical protein|tara:strand:+ start:2677 stop:2799 length:123 start_codon:yes stop_codon:yes gene_type:complete